MQSIRTTTSVTREQIVPFISRGEIKIKLCNILYKLVSRTIETKASSQREEP
jgi:hypothetical protein